MIDPIDWPRVTSVMKLLLISLVFGIVVVLVVQTRTIVSGELSIGTSLSLSEKSPALRLYIEACPQLTAPAVRDEPCKGMEALGKEDTEAAMAFWRSTQYINIIISKIEE